MTARPSSVPDSKRVEGGRDVVEPVGGDGRGDEAGLRQRDDLPQVEMLPQVDTDSSTSNLVAQKLQGTAPPATPTSMMRPALGWWPWPGPSSPRCRPDPG